MRRVLLAAAVVVAVGAGVWWFRTRGAEESVTGPATAAVGRGSIEVAVDVTGSLASPDAIDVTPANGGTVADVLVAVGETVVEGQPLVVLDTSSLALDEASAESNLQSAESALSAARASLADLEAGPDAAEAETARLDLERARNALWGVQAQRDGVCGRVKEGRGQQYECDGAQASVQQSELAVRLAEIAWQDVMDGADDGEITAARDQVAQAESKVSSARIQVEQARLKLAESTLVSPIDGTVTAVAVRKGVDAGAGQAAVTVCDLTHLELDVLLDQTDVGRVKVGQTARVTADAFEDSVLTGEVTTIALVAETESGVVLYPVTIRLGPTDVALRPGMTASATLVTASAENVLLVPRRAVTTRGPRSFVTVVDGETRQPVEVTVGLTSDSQAEVTGDVAEGQMVLVPDGTIGTSTGDRGFVMMGGPMDGGPPPGAGSFAVPRSGGGR